MKKEYLKYCYAKVNDIPQPNREGRYNPKLNPDLSELSSEDAERLRTAAPWLLGACCRLIGLLQHATHDHHFIDTNNPRIPWTKGEWQLLDSPHAHEIGEVVCDALDRATNVEYVEDCTDNDSLAPSKFSQFGEDEIAQSKWWDTKEAEQGDWWVSKFRD
jgi:hypothetical protein